MIANRLVTACLLAALAVSAGLSGCFLRTRPTASTGQAEDLDLGAVGDFALTDQDNRAVRRADLLGKVWVASFIFTRCATLCPQVSASLAELQGSLPEQDGVILVSFTVDPDNDTPPVLKTYAGAHGANPDRWLFLTGERKTMYRLIQESFHLAVAQNQGTARTAGNEVTHSSRLVLVDRRGHIRGLFDGRKVDDQSLPVNELPKLRERLEVLLREKP